MRFPRVWQKNARKPLSGGEAEGHPSEAPWKDITRLSQEQ